jgi:hypothetical protein
VDNERLDRIGSEISSPSLPSDELSQRESNKFESARWHGKQQAFHYAFLVIFWLLTGVSCIIFLIRAAHWVLPTSKSWMTPEQIKDVDAFISHGLVGGLVVALGKKFVSSNFPTDRPKD